MPERYIYVKSDESDLYFSDNKAYRFSVHLPSPLVFKGSWSIALTEFHAVDNNKNDSLDSLYVYTDLCKESIVHGEEQPLLRRVVKNNIHSWDFTFDSPYYLPVKRKEAQSFQIYIKREDGTFATDLASPLHLTLHLKQYPFY